MTEVKEITVPNNAGFDGRGGSSYIDSYALRENDATKPHLDGYESESDGALESRQYYLQNWRADLVSMIGEDGVFPGWFK